MRFFAIRKCGVVGGYVFLGHITRSSCTDTDGWPCFPFHSRLLSLFYVQGNRRRISAISSPPRKVFVRRKILGCQTFCANTDEGGWRMSRKTWLLETPPRHVIIYNFQGGKFIRFFGDRVSFVLVVVFVAFYCFRADLLYLRNFSEKRFLSP